MPSASLRGYYELLGLTNGCTELEIKSAYKRLALLHHPDKNRGSKRSEERFKLINNAYETLINAANPADYVAKPQPQPQSSQQRSQGDYSAKPKAQPRSSHQQSQQHSSQQQNSQQRQPLRDPRGKNRNRPLYPREVDFHTENTLIEHAQQVRRNWERRGILLMQNSEAEKTELKMLIERNVEVVNRVRLVTQSPYAPLERTQEIMELWREQWDVRTRMLEQMLWMEEVMEVMGVGNGSCG